MFNAYSIRLTVTGPRAHKLFGDNYNDKRYLNLLNVMTNFLIDRPFIKSVNIGMATGIDLLFGLATLRRRKLCNDLKVNCFIPGINQTRYYSEKEKEIYKFIIDRCDEVYQVTNKECAPEVLKKRSRVMVDNCDWVLAFWDYQKYKSSTYSTINYALKQDKTIYIINPLNVYYREFYHISEEEYNKRNLLLNNYFSKEMEIYKEYTSEL